MQIGVELLCAAIPGGDIVLVFLQRIMDVHKRERNAQEQLTKIKETIDAYRRNHQHDSDQNPSVAAIWKVMEGISRSCRKGTAAVQDRPQEARDAQTNMQTDFWW